MSLSKSHVVDFRVLDGPDVPVRRFPAGEEIISVGSPASEMFLVRKGAAEIRVHGKTVEVVGPGGIFGEMALIDRSPRSAAVVAKTECETVPIDERLFIILVQDAPYFVLDVMRVLVNRLRAMNQRV